MSRQHTESDSFSPDDGLPDGLELRKKKSAQQRCKRKKARSIRRGIDSYFERKVLKDQLGDEFDSDDLEDLDEDESWYH